MISQTLVSIMLSFQCFSSSVNNLQGNTDYHVSLVHMTYQLSDWYSSRSYSHHVVSKKLSTTNIDVDTINIP